MMHIVKYGVKEHLCHGSNTGMSIATPRLNVKTEHLTARRSLRA